MSRATDPSSPSKARIVLREILLLVTIGVGLFLVFEVLGINASLDGLNEISPVSDHALEILGLLTPALLGLLLFRTVQARRALGQAREQALALAENEALLRQLTENIDAVFWMTDPGKEHNLYVSSAYEAVWGRSRASLAREPTSFLDAIHEEDRARVGAAVADQADGDYDETYRVIQPDGSIRWVRDRAYPIQGPGGAVDRIAGLAEDITDRIEAEADLQTAHARFQAIAENLEDNLWILGPDGAVEYVSPAFEDLFGIPVDSLEEGYEAWLDTIHPEDRSKLELLVAAEPGTLDLDKPLAYRVCHPDGTIRWLETRMAEVRDTRGKVRWIVGITSDITARKDAQALREEAVEREVRLESLRASAEFRTRFLNRAAHDLATPLTPARFQVEALASPRLGELNNAQTEALATLRRNLDRLTRAVDQLVLAAQLEAGEVTLHQGAVDLAELVQARAAAAQGAYLASDKGLTVTIEEGVIVGGDEERLAITLDNLLEEARQLLPALRTAEATLSATETRATLTVEAEGALLEGLPQDTEPHDLEVDLHVFVARRLAEVHGGSLVVEEGSTLRFILELPRMSDGEGVAAG